MSEPVETADPFEAAVEEVQKKAVVTLTAIAAARSHCEGETPIATEEPVEAVDLQTANEIQF